MDVCTLLAQSEYCGAEEHAFIIRMGDHDEYAHSTERAARPGRESPRVPPVHHATHHQVTDNPQANIQRKVSEIQPSVGRKLNIETIKEI